VDQQFDVLNPLLQFGMYAPQVERYLEAFPQKVKVILYDDYRDRPAATLADLFSFLGVDAKFQPDFSRRMMEPHVPHFVTAAYFLKRYGLWRRVKEWSPPPLQRVLRRSVFRKRSRLALSAEDRRTLQDYYRDDIARLSNMIHRNLGFWLQ